MPNLQPGIIEGWAFINTDIARLLKKNRLKTAKQALTHLYHPY
jgi:predicted transcriptional regulator